MSDPQVVRFVPGQHIDSTHTLEIVGLSATSPAWQQIEAAYPEIRTAGPRAPFRGQRNVTIFPPHYVTVRALRSIRTIAEAGHTTYVVGSGRNVSSLLVHVHGGYESLHIWRVRN